MAFIDTDETYSRAIRVTRDLGITTLMSGNASPGDKESANESIDLVMVKPGLWWRSVQEL